MWKKQGSWNFFHAKLIPNSSNTCFFGFLKTPNWLAKGAL